MSSLDAFIMPNQVTIMARTSSITNSFVNGIIPCIAPTESEVSAALSVLGMDEGSVACAYCGDPMTEWDHLNPLVRNKRPTGFVSEIHNLVPSCGKCNQSKGNKHWREWIVSGAKKSPRSRGVPDLEKRIERLEEYEHVFEPMKLDFESIVDPELWNAHWENLERIHDVMQRCQAHSDLVKQAIADSAIRRGKKAEFPDAGPRSCHNDDSRNLHNPLGENTACGQMPARDGASVDLPKVMEGVETAANKQFAHRCLSYLEAHSSDLEGDLNTLCSKKACKAAFNHDRALLMPLEGVTRKPEAREDGKGHPRYYADTVTLKGRSFLVSKEWYGLGENDRDNRTPFLKWVLSRTEEAQRP